MNQKRIWKEYISAQSKILKHKSKPIGIDTSNPVQFNGLKLNLSITKIYSNKSSRKRLNKYSISKTLASVADIFRQVLKIPQTSQTNNSLT